MTPDLRAAAEAALLALRTAMAWIDTSRDDGHLDWNNGDYAARNLTAALAAPVPPSERDDKPMCPKCERTQLFDQMPMICTHAAPERPPDWWACPVHPQITASNNMATCWFNDRRRSTCCGKPLIPVFAGAPPASPTVDPVSYPTLYGQASPSETPALPPRYETIGMCHCGAKIAHVFDAPMGEPPVVTPGERGSTCYVCGAAEKDWVKE